MRYLWMVSMLCITYTSIWGSNMLMFSYIHPLTMLTIWLLKNNQKSKWNVHCKIVWGKGRAINQLSLIPRLRNMLMMPQYAYFFKIWASLCLSTLCFIRRKTFKNNLVFRSQLGSITTGASRNQEVTPPDNMQLQNKQMHCKYLKGRNFVNLSDY